MMDYGDDMGRGFMMCEGITCPLTRSCHRSPFSGTEPEDPQEWFIEEPYWRIPRTTETICDYYWKKIVFEPKETKTDDY